MVTSGSKIKNQDGVSCDAKLFTMVVNKPKSDITEFFSPSVLLPPFVTDIYVSFLYFYELKNTFKKNYNFNLNTLKLLCVCVWVNLVTN